MIIGSAFQACIYDTAGGLPAADSVRCRGGGTVLTGCVRISLLAGCRDQGTASVVHFWNHRRHIALRAAYRLVLDGRGDAPLRSRRPQRDDARVEIVLSLDCLSIEDVLQQNRRQDAAVAWDVCTGTSISLAILLDARSSYFTHLP